MRSLSCRLRPSDATTPGRRNSVILQSRCESGAGRFPRQAATTWPSHRRGRRSRFAATAATGSAGPGSCSRLNAATRSGSTWRSLSRFRCSPAGRALSPKSNRERPGRGAIAFALAPARPALLQRHQRTRRVGRRPRHPYRRPSSRQLASGRRRLGPGRADECLVAIAQVSVEASDRTTAFAGGRQLSARCGSIS